MRRSTTGGSAGANAVSWANAGQAVFSASRIRDLLQCPFRFFLKYLLHADPVERPGDWNEVSWLDPLTRGSAYHEILDALFCRLAAGGISGWDDESAREQVEEVVSGVLGRLQAEQLPPGAIFAHEKRILLENVLRVLASERLRFGDAGFRTVRTEGTFGMASKSMRPENLLCEDPVRVQLAGERELLLRGSIDRIDRTPDRRRVLLLDYKSGRCRIDEATPEAWTDGGDYIQHLVYGLVYEAVESPPEGTTIESGYYFIPENGEHELRLTPYRDLVEPFRELTGDLFRTIEEEGWFFRNTDSCRWCDYASVCRREPGKSTDAILRLRARVAGGNRT